MERALSLVATGTLTVAMARASKGKMVTVPRAVNRSTGTVSMQQTGFSDAAWGKATRRYAKLARSLTDAEFEAIVKHAQELMIRGCNEDSTEAIDIDDDEDERACLVDNSSSDTESKLSPSSMNSVEPMTGVVHSRFTCFLVIKPLSVTASFFAWWERAGNRIVGYDFFPYTPT